MEFHVSLNNLISSIKDHFIIEPWLFCTLLLTNITGLIGGVWMLTYVGSFIN